ncbi:DUF790 family protein [Methanohalobium sp.]|uniref:DUF790 family protein n=1 Tax=Methanohalobium sp. TaxID=2837493 RepID=UPI0025E3AC0A|nr:DUF790 family protein [Methanohalobium sp.]
MLPSELLVTKTYRGNVKPVYASSEHIKTADMLIETFNRYIENTYGNLMEEIQGFEEMNYRLIRGLTQILLRRCRIESNVDIDPVELRQAVFEECSKIITSREERDNILYNVAEKYSLSKDELEQNLWADIDENKIIKNFQPISSDELLKQYNISLIQTLLFKAVDLDLKIKGNFKNVLQAVLRSRLMYSFNEVPVSNNNNEEIDSGIETVNLHIDGPASIFKMTERYGKSFAKLVPHILECRSWYIRADISHKTNSGKRVLEFTASSSDDIFGLKTSQNQIKESPNPLYSNNKKTEFDSSIEYEFAQFSFREWSLYREPAILKTGKYAFIPDFSLKKGNLTVYVEIIGFWTHEYLKKKIEKVNKVDVPIILLINNKLKCSESDFKAKNADVLFYSKKIPYKQIMQILRRYEEKELEKEHDRIKNIDVPPDKNIININDLAEKENVWKNALKQKLENQLNDDSEYLIFGDYLIHKNLIQEIDLQIKNLKTYSDVVDVFDKYKLDKQVYYLVLEHLGYKVVWKGLSEDTAEIQKG